MHPDEAVAIGAALLAQSLNSAEGVVLIDVRSHLHRSRAPGRRGRVKPIIDRNTPLPVRKQYGSPPPGTARPSFDLWIVEGEGSTVAECEYLGTIQLTGLPRGPRGIG